MVLAVQWKLEKEFWMEARGYGIEPPKWWPAQKSDEYEALHKEVHKEGNEPLRKPFELIDALHTYHQGLDALDDLVDFEIQPTRGPFFKGEVWEEPKEPEEEEVAASSVSEE